MKRSAVLGVILALCWTSPAIAMTISASPVIIQSDLPPGVSAEQTVTISNGASEPLEFEVEPFDLGLDEEGNQARFSGGTLPGSMAGWLTLQPAKFSVPPGGQTTVKVIISVPPDASGGHQAALVFRTRAPLAQPDGRMVRVGAAIAVKLFAAVEGKAERRLEVIETQVRPPSTHERATVQLLIRNAGNAFLRASAETAILDENRNLVGRGTALPTSILIQGQSSTLTIDWGGELPDGNYTALTTVLYTGGATVVEEKAFSVGEPSVAPGPSGAPDQ
jgi:hypothetical protein